MKEFQVNHVIEPNVPVRALLCDDFTENRENETYLRDCSRLNTQHSLTLNWNSNGFHDTRQ